MSRHFKRDSWNYDSGTAVHSRWKGSHFEFGSSLFVCSGADGTERFRIRQLTIGMFVSRCPGLLRWFRTRSGVADVLAFSDGSKRIRIRQLTVGMFGFSCLDRLQWIINCSLSMLELRYRTMSRSSCWTTSRSSCGKTSQILLWEMRPLNAMRASSKKYSQLTILFVIGKQAPCSSNPSSS